MSRDDYDYELEGHEPDEDREESAALLAIIAVGSCGDKPSPDGKTITSPTSGQAYKVYPKLAETAVFTLYRAVLPDSGQVGMLKVAKTTANNADLEVEAQILAAMHAKAVEMEGHRPESVKPYNYHLFTPRLVESFISTTQGGRRINVLAYPDIIEEVARLVPLARLNRTDHVRVSPKTAVWIGGKLLKILTFAHDMGISNGMVTPTNILIETEDYHGVMLFDWTLAQEYPGKKVPREVVRDELALAARAVFIALGGNPLTGFLPDSDELNAEQHEQFAGFFLRLMAGNGTDAGQEKEGFYDLADSFWPRMFSPFTTYPLSVEADDSEGTE